MILTHAEHHPAPPGSTSSEPACGTTTPDDTGYVFITTVTARVDCIECAVALGAHVCGLSNLDPYCDGCSAMMSDAGY